MKSRLQRFMELEAAGGITLGIAALAALVFANSPLGPLYTRFLEVPLSIQIDMLVIAKPLLMWIDDGLMAIFFMLVAMEIKREIREGDLSTPSLAALPVVAALGGMIVPALFYLAFTWGDTEAMRGWAIPDATDIAFALGVLALLGSRVPASLKIFLLALAIIDDLGAIIIIAVFYTAELSMLALALAAVGVVALIILNLLGIARRSAYVLVGIFLWICVLKSGVHATLAGVVVGLAIPVNVEGQESPLRSLEHDLHPWVTFMILPLFAFANAGVRFADIPVSSLSHPVQLGVITGLLLGKPLGVVGAVWAMVRLGLASLPEAAGWAQLVGVGILTGIGFTMSLFIGALAFPTEGYNVDVRIGVLIASVVAAGSGYLVLRLATPRAVLSSKTAVSG
jgi:Na+:H+ antiporter, NhaA family